MNSSSLRVPWQLGGSWCLIDRNLNNSSALGVKCILQQHGLYAAVIFSSMELRIEISVVKKYQFFGWIGWALRYEGVDNLWRKVFWDGYELTKSNIKLSLGFFSVGPLD